MDICADNGDGIISAREFREYLLFVSVSCLVTSCLLKKVLGVHLSLAESRRPKDTVLRGVMNIILKIKLNTFLVLKFMTFLLFTINRIMEYLNYVLLV